MAELLDAQENTIKQILKDWYKESRNNNGRKRASIDVSASFVPLLQWIISWWGTEEKSLVLAADASTLGERFTLLVICVVYRGCGIPVAWKILPGNQKGSWKPYWLELFQNIEKGIPQDWFVIVTTDRGLYASWLYQAIIEAGWHPFMRIKSQGSFSSEGNEENWKPLKSLITEVGTRFRGKVKCFRTNPIECTLLGQWDTGHADPWLIVTDLEPGQARACWYSMRCWIECLFKDIKRGGFEWHNTKMTDPKRAERLWLAIAVATLWLVSVGGNTENPQSPFQTYQTNDDEPTGSPVTGAPSAIPTVSAPISNETGSPTTGAEPAIPTVTAPSSDETASSTTAFSVSPTVTPDFDSPSNVQEILVPTLSCFRRGFITILAALLKGNPIPTSQFIPDFSPAPG